MAYMDALKTQLRADAKKAVDEHIEKLNTRFNKFLVDKKSEFMHHFNQSFLQVSTIPPMPTLMLTFDAAATLYSTHPRAFDRYRELATSSLRDYKEDLRIQCTNHVQDIEKQYKVLMEKKWGDELPQQVKQAVKRITETSKSPKFASEPIEYDSHVQAMKHKLRGASQREADMFDERVTAAKGALQQELNQPLDLSCLANRKRKTFESMSSSLPPDVPTNTYTSRFYTAPPNDIEVIAPKRLELPKSQPETSFTPLQPHHIPGLNNYPVEPSQAFQAPAMSSPFSHPQPHRIPGLSQNPPHISYRPIIQPGIPPWEIVQPQPQAQHPNQTIPGFNPYLTPNIKSMAPAPQYQYPIPDSPPHSPIMPMSQVAPERVAFMKMCAEHDTMMYDSVAGNRPIGKSKVEELEERFKGKNIREIMDELRVKKKGKEGEDKGKGKETMEAVDKVVEMEMDDEGGADADAGDGGMS